MNEEELNALLGILKEDSGISNTDVLSEVISNEGIEVVYSEVQDGIFSNEQSFARAFPSLKKKEDGVSESADGMPVSSEKVEETPLMLQDQRVSQFGESFGVLPREEKPQEEPQPIPQPVLDPALAAEQTGLEGDPTAPDFVDRQEQSLQEMAKNQLSDPIYEELEKDLARIDLSGKNEEQAVVELNKLLGPYDFKFDQTGLAKDAVRITSPNNETKVVNFGGFMQRNLPGFLGFASPIDAAAELIMGEDTYQEDEISSFVRETFDITANIKEREERIINEQELNDYTQKFNTEAKNFLKQNKQLRNEANAIAKASKGVKKGTPEYDQLLDRVRAFELEKEKINERREALKLKGKEYDKLVGDYTLMRREQGGFFRQTADQLKSSVGKLLGFGMETSPLLTMFAMASKRDIGELKYGEEERFVNPFSQIATRRSIDTDKGYVEMAEDLPFTLLGRSSTKEYLEGKQQADLFSADGLANVFFGVVEFLPAAGLGMPGTIALSSQYVSEEIRNNPNFDDIPEAEKLAISLGIGSVIGVIENLGFKNVMQSKPMMGIINRVFSKNPATMRTAEELIDQEVKSMVAKGLLTIGAGGLAEFETGAAQEFADIGLKEIYNTMKGTDMFDTPESMEEAAYQIFMGGVAEGLGGKMMATPKAFSKALNTNTLSEVDNNTFSIFEKMSKDSKYYDFIESKLKQDVVNQEMTTQEKDKILSDYNRLAGAMQNIPEGVKPEYKKRLLGLFMDYKRIDDKIKSRDDVFNKNDKKEKAQIENRINAILEESEVDATVDQIRETKPEEKKTFYAEKIEDIPEQYRERAEKIDNDGSEITFRQSVLGLPIGKRKSVPVEEYYSYTLDGNEIQETVQLERDVETVKEESGEVEESAPVTENYATMEEIPQAIQNAPSTEIVENEEGGFDVTYRGVELAEQVLKERLQKDQPRFRAKEVDVETVYHGTPTAIEGGALKRGRSGAIFLTPSKKYAEVYSGETGSVIQIEISEQKKQNLFDLRNPEHVERLKEGFLNNNEELEIEYDSKEDALRDYENALRSMREASEGREGINDWSSGSQYVEVMENAGFEGALFAERPAGVVDENVVISYALFDKTLPIQQTTTKDQDQAKFRLKEGEGRIEEDVKLSEDVKVKTEAMPQKQKDFVVPRGKPVRENVDPIAESPSETKLTEQDAKDLGFESLSEMTKKIEEFEGIPMGIFMSDHLATGTLRDAAGKEMNTGGGILFNTLGSAKNRLLAWAGIDAQRAGEQYKEALDIYNANKALFDRLWSEDKIPYGHVPFAVAKMADSAINSNEAVYRWLNPRLKQLERKYRGRAKSALNTFVADLEALEGLTPEQRKTLEETRTKLEADPTNAKLQEKIDKLEEKQSKQVLLDFIKKNKIKTISKLLDAVVADAQKRAKDPKSADLNLPVRSFLFDRIFSVSNAKEIKKVGPSKNWIKELLADSKSKNEENQVFIANSDIGVYNKITEPSMREGRQGEIVSIVGVKVVDEDGNQAGGVAESDHQNYGFGPEGRFISFISNPMHGTDVFPEFEVKAARIFKVDKQGKSPSPQKVLSQIGGAFFMDKAFRGMKPLTGKKRGIVDLLVAKMRHAFPNVGITSSKADFDALMERDDVRTRVKDGMVVYGVTLDGVIYLNPDAVDLATPIHEFGHIWLDYLRYQSLDRPRGKAAKLLKKGFELAKEDSRFKEYLKKYGDSDLAAEELLVELIATRGETIVNASLRAKFKEWFNAFFKYIKENFIRSKDIASKKIKDLTIEEFANIGLADLFGGTLLDGKFDPSKVTDALRARFSIQKSDGSIVSIDEVVRILREEGVSDQNIRELLKKEKYKVEDINKAMEIQVDLNTKMPDAFVNVFGGAKVGVDMFNDIMKKLNNWAKSRWGKGKTFTEFRIKALELLEGHDTFKAQKKIDQNRLVAAMDLIIGRKPAKDASIPINQMKQTVRLLRDNNWKSNIKAAKFSLNNAVKFLEGSKINEANFKKIKSIIGKLNDKNFKDSVKEIDTILSDAIKKDKEASNEINSNVSVINKKISSYNQGLKERSNTIKEIVGLVNALIKDVPSSYKSNIKGLLKDVASIDEAKADVKLDKIMASLDNFYKKEVDLKKKADLKKLKEINAAIASEKKKRRALVKEVNGLIHSLSKGLSKEYKHFGVLKSIIKDASGITLDNASKKLDRIMGHIGTFMLQQDLMKEKKNAMISTIESLKSKIKTNEEQARNLRDVKLKIARLIKKSTQALRDLGVRNYTYSQVQKLVYRVETATAENIANEIDRVLKVFNDAKEQYRKSKLSSINKYINKNAKKTDIGARGQSFFVAAKKLKDYLEKQPIDKETLLEYFETRDDLLSTYTGKEYKDMVDALPNNKAKEFIKEIDKILEKESEYAEISSIPDLLLGMDSMTLEELNDLEMSFKASRIVYATQLASKKAAERAIIKELVDQANANFQEDFSMLYTTFAGETILKTQNEKEAQRKIKKLMTVKGVVKLLNNMRDDISNYQLSRFMGMGHLGSICNGLDNKPMGRTFFTDNVYKVLNRAYSRYLAGKQSNLDLLNRIADSVFPGLTYKDVKKKIFKEVDDISVRYEQREGSSHFIDGVLYSEAEFNAIINKMSDDERKKSKVEIKKTTRLNYQNISGDEQMRIYALSLNPIQREKLKRQGIDDSSLNWIESNLGPELTAFAREVVKYLSNEYYDETNAVYSNVNNINLKKIDNYFPTRTESLAAIQQELEGISNGDFKKTFILQHASLLQDRTNLTDAIRISEAYGFTSELERHIDDAERYKAYANDVKTINRLLKSKPVATVLAETRIGDIMYSLINNEVNPVSSVGNDLGSLLLSGYVGKAISLKPMQFIKQASSLVLSFMQYENKSTKNLPIGAKLTADVMAFSYDQAMSLLSFVDPRRPNVLKQAYELSPVFRERIDRFFRGAGFASIETSMTEKEANNLFRKTWNMVQRVGGVFTMAGDIAGVLGYMAVYNRDIKNGIPPAKALERFEDYNKTQQTARGTEINIIQLQAKRNKNAAVRFMFGTLTTFQSSLFLLYNLSAQSVGNLLKTYSGEKNKSKAIYKMLRSDDFRTLMMSAGIGNALFALVSNMWKLIYGGSDDEEEVLNSAKQSLLGFNLLISIPVVGVGVESALNYYNEKPYRASDGVNPVSELSNYLINKSREKDKKKEIKESDLYKVKRKKDEKPFMLEVGEYFVGLNTDMFLGILDYALDRNKKTRFFKVIGSPKSQQPTPPKEVKESDLYD